MDRLLCSKCATLRLVIEGTCEHIRNMIQAEKVAIITAVESQKFTVNIGTPDRRSEVEVPIGRDVAAFIYDLKPQYVD